MPRTLNVKIFFTALATLTIMVAFVYAVLAFVVAPRFADVDRAALDRNVSRIRAALAGELEDLQRSNQDWAHWDETYNFVAGRNPEFIANNLYPRAISDLNVSLFNFYDQAGELVWDLNRSALHGDHAVAAWPTSRPLPNRSKGVLLSSRGPMLLVAEPILTSRGEGPARGTLVLGRLLDDAELATLSRRIAVPVEIRAPDAAFPPTLAPIVARMRTERAEAATAREGDLLLAAFVLRDLEGQPAAIVSTALHMDASAIGARAIALAMACLVAVGLVDLLIALYLLRSVVLRPLTRLEAHIVRVGRSGELAPFAGEQPPDQLGRLAREFNRMIGALADLRAREAEQSEAYKRALEASQAAYEAKSRFLAHMSHELRTPLNAIIGFSEVIEAELLGPVGTTTYRHYAADIHSSGRHLLSLVDDILDLSRAETGRLELGNPPFDLRGLIEEGCRFVAHQADRSGLTLTCDAMPGLLVIADPRLCRQMILNLLSNAVKFTPSGGRVTVTTGLDGDGRIRISVCDSGIGMTEQEVALALEAFGQVTQDPMVRSRGVGLGLSLTKRFIELHGGTLAVESRPGNGTCATLVFPAARSAPAHVAACPIVV